MGMLFRFLIVIAALLVAGCRQDAVACRTHVSSDAIGNAGCWVVSKQQLLLVQQRSGKYSFPGGTSVPGELAQCTAHRETLEETGFNVSVGELKHRFDNGFYLFNCRASGDAAAVQAWMEVADVVWVAPADIPQQQWRFPYQRAMAIGWLRE